MTFKFIVIIHLLMLFQAVCAEDITVVSGKVYKNAKVLTRYSNGIEIRYENDDGTFGMKLLRTESLPQNIREKYNLVVLPKVAVQPQVSRKSKRVVRKSRKTAYYDKLKERAEREYFLAALAAEAQPGTSLNEIRSKMLSAQIACDSGKYNVARADWYFVINKSSALKRSIWDALKKKAGGVSDRYKNYADRYLASGNTSYRSGSFSSAIRYYNRAISRNPGCAPAYSNLGLALHKEGKLSDAISALAKAVAYDPDNPYYYLNLGKIYAASQKYEYALLAFDEAVKYKPYFPAALYNRLWVLDEQRNIGQAVKLAEQLKRRRSAPEMTPLLIGIVYARKGEPELLAAAVLDTGSYPQKWQWLGAVNQSIASGGTASYDSNMQKDFGQACRLVSTELFNDAKKQLELMSAAAPGSPIPYWIDAMVNGMQNNTYVANRLMVQAHSLLPKFDLSGDKDVIDVFVDRKPVKSVGNQISLLPGAHLLEIRAGGGKSKRLIIYQNQTQKQGAQ